MNDKKIKFDFLHTCDYVSVDQFGKLNLLGVFENINTLDFPLINHQFFVVTNILISESGNYECVIKISDPDSTEIGKFVMGDLKVSIGKDNPTFALGIIAQFNNIKFEKAAKYKLEVIIEGVSIFSKDLPVQQILNKNAK